jgi:hypothetical protein
MISWLSTARKTILDNHRAAFEGTDGPERKDLIENIKELLNGASGRKLPKKLGKVC